MSPSSFSLTRIGLSLVLSLALLAPLYPIQARPDLPAQAIYTDDLASGWSNWSWAEVDLQAGPPVYAGSYSIRVSYNAWQGLYLHYPQLETAGFEALRFYIHGGSAGGQQVQVYATYMVDGSEVNGPAVSLPAPAAGVWSEVRLPLSELGAADAALTGLIWQDTSGGAQPALYLDDIALVSNESPDGPVLSSGSLHPRAALAGSAAGVAVRVQVSDPQGAADLASVTLAGDGFGGGMIALYDDGWHNDGGAQDGLYGAVFDIPASAASGEIVLLVSAQDQAGHQASLSLGAFDILTPIQAAIPAALPQRLGWGSNAWSETPGEDWQVNSGVPWDFVYQYITYEWYEDGWGGNFVGRFVGQAWDKGYIPLISVYLFLALPPNCGESAACYASKLQNAGSISLYLEALAEAARQAQGAQPVIFQLEPDFYGYMQQLSNSGSPPPGVQPDDPGSYPAAVNLAGYANTLAGFGQRMVDVIHATAPNALVAPHASMWATNGDPNAATVAEAMAMGQRTAAFIDAMGGAQADLLTVEWSDRDAGSGLRPWWDDTNLSLPRPARAILWENALAATAGKRLLLWQMPVGNMSLDNTCDHYQDNRAAYVFQHPRDLFDAGVVGVLFGGGAACMTQVTTDGGFVGAQGAIAYALPGAPAGLRAGAAVGPVVRVGWDESGEPDLWGYQVAYQPAGGGAVVVLDAGRRSAMTVVLPYAGSWLMRAAAYDAMGQVSAWSSPISVVTTADARQYYLPLIAR